MKKYVLFVLSAAILFASLTASHAVVLSQGKSIVKIGEDINLGQYLRMNDLLAINGDVNVKGQVVNDVVAVLGTVHLFPTARVGGDVVVVGGKLIKDAGAQVGGETVQRGFEGATAMNEIPTAAIGSVNFFAVNILMFLGLLGLAILFAALMTRQVGVVSSYIEKNWWKSLLWGILGAILIIPVAGLLAVTIIGIPLILVEIVFISLALALGLVGVSQLIGKKVTRALRRPGQPMMLEGIIGIVVLFLVNLVPLLGGLVCLVAATMGFGSALVNKLGFQK
jgi:hypothetical protein